MDLLCESIIVGIVLVIISSIFMAGLHTYYPNDYTGCKNLPNESSQKYYITTFFIGVATHLAFEYAGANKWYCTNGNVCK